LFKIERKFVNLAARQYIQVEARPDEAGAAGGTPEAAAFDAEQIRAEAHKRAVTEAQERAQDILSEALANANTKALQIISEARDEAAALIVEAREQADAERHAAWQEGFTEGSEEGRHSYDEKLASKLREDDEMLKRVIEELHNERTNTYDRLEDDVVALAVQIVRKVVNPSGDELGGYFESMITGALRQLNPDGKVAIRVSPQEQERFFPSGSAAFELDSGIIVTASVFKDATLGAGDCIIDTEDSTVNAGLDSQLRYVELAFEQVES